MKCPASKYNRWRFDDHGKELGNHSFIPESLTHEQWMHFGRALSIAIPDTWK